jgi:hypothetical protein
MANRIRDVLERFENQTAPLSLNQMAREMDITPGVLRGMIDYLVRRGDLREVTSDGSACTSCGVKGGCPFVVLMPRYYERVRDDDDSAATMSPPCQTNH